VIATRTRPAPAVHLDPECCTIRVDTDGSLVVVARHGKHVVGGYSGNGYSGDHARLQHTALRELERAVQFFAAQEG
jgi:hypothetical protein